MQVVMSHSTPTAAVVSLLPFRTLFQVKDAGISAMAATLALLGDALPSQLPASLQVR